MNAELGEGYLVGRLRLGDEGRKSVEGGQASEVSPCFRRDSKTRVMLLYEYCCGPKTPEGTPDRKVSQTARRELQEDNEKAGETERLLIRSCKKSESYKLTNELTNLPS